MSVLGAYMSYLKLDFNWKIKFQFSIEVPVLTEVGVGEGERVYTENTRAQCGCGKLKFQLNSSFKFDTTESLVAVAIAGTECIENKQTSIPLYVYRWKWIQALDQLFSFS